MKIAYLRGDATKPISDGRQAFVAHICNDLGAWGAGFVLAINKTWGHDPRLEYQRWGAGTSSLTDDPFELGYIQYVLVDPYRPIWVVNMLAQEGVGGKQAVRYRHLLTCLNRLGEFLESTPIPSSVHMPRIGCGLGGGSWNVVEALVHSALIRRGIQVYVYDLP